MTQSKPTPAALEGLAATDVTFLREAARYFANQPADEDRAHWANVYNAGNCSRIADVIERGLQGRTASAEAGHG